MRTEQPTKCFVPLINLRFFIPLLWSYIIIISSNRMPPCDEICWSLENITQTFVGVFLALPKRNFPFVFLLLLLAHLSRRLIGELIVYQWSGVRRTSSSVRRRPSVVHNAQTSSSPKPLGRSKPNFMWSLLG